jgi:hypothetical protein
LSARVVMEENDGRKGGSGARRRVLGGWKMEL